MRILLDTNIIIHREASRVIVPEIGTLFNWLDRLHHQKCVHPLTVGELRKHKDQNVVRTFEAKVNSYHILKTEAPETPEIQAVRAKYDKTDNDFVDTSLLKEVFAGRVDLLLTEDTGIHEKASDLGVSPRVFTIDAFLEKCVAENPELVDYKVLAVKRAYMGDLNLEDPFFSSLRSDYVGFDDWFKKKSDEVAYVCKGDDDELLAFLYLKDEGSSENYANISPIFLPKYRLKVGTFKVVSTGFKLGERFLKIIFDNAQRKKVQEIYVTIFGRTDDQRRLIDLLKEYGFYFYGTKQSASGEEQVYVRDFSPKVDPSYPNLTFPYFSRNTNKFIVPIYPQYHTELFPDSILKTESANNFMENRANRNAISKVYISRSIERSLKPGDVIVFYRTKDKNAGFYTSVTTTIGVVQNVITDISTVDEFIRLCRKRSVFSDQELADIWNEKPKYRPFIVNFLYICSFPKRLNLQSLTELGIISQAPRGFERLSDIAFQTLLEHSNADQRLIVDKT